ncbi:MAG: beta-lactamase regulator AmpE [Serratia symbiotica]|nr:beta-lactamase regulator AmpE [Serratia symbiotica]
MSKKISALARDPHSDPLQTPRAAVALASQVMGTLVVVVALLPFTACCYKWQKKSRYYGQLQLFLPCKLTAWQSSVARRR